MKYLCIELLILASSEFNHKKIKSLIQGDAKVLLNDCKTKHPDSKYYVLYSSDKLIEPSEHAYFITLQSASFP